MASCNAASLRANATHFCSQAVSYVDPAAVMLESGTRNPSALPGALYGCPYPSSQDGECRPPASCNCYQVQCSVQSAMIQLLHTLSNLRRSRSTSVPAQCMTS